MPSERVGFIGLGVMGLPMAQHLAAAGYPLTVHDLNAHAPTTLRVAHPEVQVAATPEQVAARSDIVVTMLPSGREVKEVVLGSEGVLRGLSPGGLVLDTSSSEPWYTDEIAAGLSAAGHAMVDAPVSGAEAGALAAELVFMVGGDSASVQRVRPLLEVLGRRIFHVGPVGAGHTMKSINNLITAATFLATAEGLIMGKAAGLDPAVMTDVLNESTGMSWISRTHIGQRILTRRFDDPFKLDLMVKDINIALQVAETLQIELPLSQATRQQWHEIQSVLPRASSVSELVRALEKRTGIQLVS